MITSAQNPLIKTIRALLRDRKAREQSGQFVVEGIQGVVEAVEQGVPLHVILYAPDLLTSTRAHEAIEQAEAHGIRVEQTTAELFASLSGRENPVGILAVAMLPLADAERLSVTAQSLFVALYQIGDPGNLGTIIRTVDATGAQGILLVGKTVDLLHPAVVKASASTIFSVPVARLAGLPELRDWCAARGAAIVAATDKAERSYWEAEYPRPLVLLMGSEARGLPREFLDETSHTVRIPMAGNADSLNLAVATALLLYESQRQSGALPPQ